jgi:hypothetical protein
MKNSKKLFEELLQTYDKEPLAPSGVGGTPIPPMYGYTKQCIEMQTMFKQAIITIEKARQA